MKIVEFKKLIEKEEPKKIIAMHYTSRVYLTDKQLDIVLNLKDKKENGWRKDYGRSPK